MKRIVLIVATGFGLGLSPFASGTAGTLLGVLIVMGMAPLPLAWQIPLAVFMAMIAIPICGGAEAIYGKKDDGRIVADEFFTFPLCMLGLPWAQHYWLLGMGFVTHRILDIIKPPPARQAQNITGGTGIVLDDVVSSLYALGLNHAIWWMVGRMVDG